MTAFTLTGRQLATEDGWLDWPWIEIDADGMVRRIGSGEPSEDETTLVPAFLDVHVHGAAGQDVMEGTPAALRRVGNYLATRGVGHFLATTVTASVETTLRALDGIAGVIQAGEDRGAVPVGIHLEGPFLSHAKRGVHPEADLQPPSIELFERMQQAAHGLIRLITLAPEVPGALDLVNYAVARGVRVSLGHSDATAAQARAAISAGATSATHTFNAMRRLDHREPGIAGAVLDDAGVFAELICDGIHVAPEFVRLWLRSKGESKAILVTDGISATGMPDGEHLLAGLPVLVKDGRCLLASDLRRGVETLAGSVLTMDRAVANLRRMTGADLGLAVRLASANPARMLGLDALAGIAVGTPANLNVYSAEGVLAKTMLRGRWVDPA